ncbi:hypothetical protein ACHAQH_000863 [Verticillium albo-atrum]
MAWFRRERSASSNDFEAIRRNNERFSGDEDGDRQLLQRVIGGVVALAAVAGVAALIKNAIDNA